MELHWTTLCHSPAAEGEDLLHQLFGTFSRSEHILEMLPHGTALRYFIDGELREAQDSRQDIIEVMGNAPGQSANGFHFLGLAQLRFKLFAFGDVAEDQHHAP